MTDWLRFWRSRYGATIPPGAAAVTVTGITVALAADAYFLIARRDINQVHVLTP